MTDIPDDPCDEWPKLLIEVRDLSNAAWTPMFSPSTMALFAHARESMERDA